MDTLTFTDKQKKFWADWIAALRSGKYPQTEMALQDPHGFCCLGVACDLSKIGHWDDNLDYEIGASEPLDAEIPDHLWLQLAGWNGPVTDPTGGTDQSFLHMCMGLNDDHEWDFSAIADWVEEVGRNIGAVEEEHLS